MYVGCRFETIQQVLFNAHPYRYKCAHCSAAFSNSSNRRKHEQKCDKLVSMPEPGAARIVPRSSSSDTYCPTVLLGVGGWRL